MMRNFLLITLLLLVAKVTAVDTTYYAALRNNLILADKEYKISTYQSLANTCERIIAMRENEWLPLYYCAYAYVHIGYMTEDEERKDIFFDTAQASIDTAYELNPMESEIQLVKALICYGRMEINPMFRGAIYFPKANDALEKAKALNPENPRIYYLEGKTTIYKPAFMGGGVEAAMPILEKALQYYTEFESPFDIYPHWGEESTLALYQYCREEIEKE